MAKTSLVSALALLLSLALAAVPSRPSTTSALPSYTYSLPTGQATVSLFVPYLDPQPLVASVISTSASLTTYKLTCPNGGIDDPDACELPSQGANLTVDPSKSIYLFAVSAAVPQSSFSYSFGYACTLVSAARLGGAGTCNETLSFNALTTNTVETLGAPNATNVMPVVITAVASGVKLSDVSTTATATGSVSGSAKASSSSGAAAAVRFAGDQGRVVVGVGFFGMLAGLVGLL